jgi:hypothetical protein
VFNGHAPSAYDFAARTPSHVALGGEGDRRLLARILLPISSSGYGDFKG